MPEDDMDIISEMPSQNRENSVPLQPSLPLMRDMETDMKTNKLLGWEVSLRWRKSSTNFSLGLLSWINTNL
jgi:hypothetical protein